jgi:cytochrome c oxidase subunit II
MLRRAKFACLSIACALLTGCPKQQSALDPTGPQAALIDHLFWFIFWVTLIVYCIVLTIFSFGIGKRRVGKEIPPPTVIHETKAEAPLATIVAASTLVTVILLFIILVKSVEASKWESQALQSKNPISIQVVGHQWWWEVTYPNTQPDQIVTTANEIHIPVGVPVVINSTSRDVIHSLWAPNIHGKRDLIPGYTTAVWIQADQEGRFRGQCAEFCGHQHAHMAFFIVAESPDKFQQWMQQQLKPAADPTDPLATRGKQIFTSRTCVMCHTVRGTEAGSRVGPDLTHLASRETIAAGTLPNNIGNLAGWVTNPQSIKPGNRMPPNPMNSEDLQALLAYLQTLR